MEYDSVCPSCLLHQPQHYNDCPDQAHQWHAGDKCKDANNNCGAGIILLSRWLHHWTCYNNHSNGRSKLNSIVKCLYCWNNLLKATCRELTFSTVHNVPNVFVCVYMLTWNEVHLFCCLCDCQSYFRFRDHCIPFIDENHSQDSVEPMQMGKIHKLQLAIRAMSAAIHK